MIHNPLKSSRSGFTLIELMIAMVIAGISIAAMYSVFASVQRTSTSNEVTAKVMESLHTCIGFMESDIRMAGLDRYGTAHAGIKVATATELQFTSDRSGPAVRADGTWMDGTINTANLADVGVLQEGGLQEVDLEQITYSYDAANKRLIQCLSVNNPLVLCDTVAENVVENPENLPIFTYFDANNSETTDTTLMRAIEVSITVQQPAGRADPVSRTLTRRIFCRNLAMK